MKLLVVDDDRILMKGLLYVLTREGFEVDSAYDGGEAIEKIRNNEYDLILLDNMLPVYNGFEVCSKVRAFSDVPIIMLTAKSADEDKLAGFASGADDYVTKPFNVQEVVARVKAVGRRRAAPQQQAGEKDGIYLDYDRRDAIVDGERAGLTVKEFDVLEFLMKNPGKAFSRVELFSMIWKQSDADARTVDVHIRRLREKIEKDPADPQLIMTKWGVGYYFRVD